MKTLKSLFMLCAGLSFCACSSDNEPQLPEGSGKVVVKIVPPASTRTVTTPSEGDNGGNTIAITGKYTVTLDATQGGKTVDEIEPKDGEAIEIIFENVQYPKSVTVTLNTGKESYAIADLTTIGSLPANSVPAYGYTPVADFEKVVVDNLTTYTAKVNMCIPVARLEIGNITFTNTDDFFSDLTVGGVYLDKLRPTSIYTYTKNAEAFVGATEQGDYQFEEGGEGEGGLYKLGDADGTTNLVTPGAVLPASEQVYAYNFFGGTDAANNPKFKIWFSSSQNENDDAAVERWAIMNFQKNSADIALENGKIYQVESAALEVQNIVGAEENDMQYVVNVQVKEATWTIEEIDGVWEN